MKYVFIAAIAAIIARGILGLIDPSALNVHTSNPAIPEESVEPSVQVSVKGRRGTIRGHMSDAKTGESLPGARVLVVDVKTVDTLGGLVDTFNEYSVPPDFIGIEGRDFGSWGHPSDAEGTYQIIRVPPGTYRLVGSHAGYRDYQTIVTLDSISGVRVDFRLAPVRTQRRPGQ